MAAPQAGVAYPAQLGPSFDTARPDDAAGGLCLLRYDFKPASAARTGAGDLSLDPHSGRASLQLPHSTPGAAPLQFTGSYEPLADGCDCVATFDGQQWHLEVLTSQCRNLRAARTSGGTAEPPAKRPRVESDPAAADAAAAAAPAPASLQMPASAEPAPAAEPVRPPSRQQQQKQQSSAQHRRHPEHHTQERPPEPTPLSSPEEPPPQQQAPQQPDKAQQHVPPEQEPQASLPTGPVPDWQEGFFPAAESSEESGQSDEDSVGDF